MKTVFIVALAVVLVVGLIFTSCAEPASPTPKEMYEVTFRVLSAASATYVIGVVLADQVNKDSEWLRATCPEGISSDVILKSMVEGAPDALLHSFFWQSEGTLWNANQHTGAFADPPFNTFDYNEFRPCFFWAMAANVLVTLNPEIKTLKDLEGKSGYSDDTPGSNNAVFYRTVMKNAGVNVTFEYMKRGAAVEALKDGLIDFMRVGTEPQLGGEWKGGSGLPELMATHSPYFIQVDPSVYEATIKELDYPAKVGTLPGGQFGTTQPDPVTLSLGPPMWWGAHESMPDEVVTEFMRIVYEYCETWEEYRPSQAVNTKQTLGSIGVPESRYHPAALKFLKDKGVPITTFGVAE